jgi:hypothetical protein
MLVVNSTSDLYLYDPQLEGNALAVRVLQSQLGRVECYNDVDVAFNEFMENDDAPKMALVNMPVADAVLNRLLDEQCVLVLRNLNHDGDMSRLLEACCQHMPKGQTYTNNKIAILNPNPKLQRESFLLWL